VHRWLIRQGKYASNQPYNNSYYLAMAHAALGESDEAFTMLEECLELRSNYVVGMKVEPGLDPLRSDPRFDDLLRRVGLAE